MHSRTIAPYFLAACAASLAAGLPAYAQRPEPTTTVKEVMERVRVRHQVEVKQWPGVSGGLELLKTLQPVCDARIANFFRTGDPAQSDPSIPNERLMQLTLPRSAVTSGLMNAVAADYIWCLNREVAARPDVRAKIDTLTMRVGLDGVMRPRSLEENLRAGREKAASNAR